MYTHSYSFNPDICLHMHSSECTVRLLNQAGRNNYPYRKEGKIKKRCNEVLCIFVWIQNEMK